MERLRFCLNGQWVEEVGLSPTTTLLRYLRDRQGLSATKEGCAEGDCGACTVAVMEPDAAARSQFRAINACLVLLPMVQGKQVLTAEGIRDGSASHPVQTALTERMGSQCGYCTPGVVMSLFEACYRTDLREPWQVDSQMCGNLCRCTGYRPIREAAREVAALCPSDRFLESSRRAAAPQMALTYRAGAQRYRTPTSLPALWRIFEEDPEARPVVGGTDLSLEVTKRNAHPTSLVSLEALPELKALTSSARTVEIGAAVNLTDLEDFARAELPMVARMLRYFGSRQIRNRASVGGNLCNASPVGDLAPVFLALGAEVVLASAGGERQIPLEHFFLGYRKTALGAGEILARLIVPRPSAQARLGAYKVSKRREVDISAVSAGLAVDLTPAGQVAAARFAFGGMAATPARARLAEAAVIRHSWNEETVEGATHALAEDFQPLSDHRGSAWYRLTVAQNLIRGFFLETREAPFRALPHPHAATVLVDDR